MSSIQQQFVSAGKAQLEAQIGLLNTLTAKAFEGAEKILELNLNTTIASLDGASNVVKEIGTGAIRQNLFSAALEKATPNAGKALDCGRELVDIAASAHAEFTRTAEVQIDETTRTLETVIDEASRNAPQGSERAIAVMRAVLDNANVGFRQYNRNLKQAMDTVQFSMKTASNLVAQVAENAARMSRGR